MNVSSHDDRLDQSEEEKIEKNRCMHRNSKARSDMHLQALQRSQNWTSSCFKAEGVVLEKEEPNKISSSENSVFEMLRAEVTLHKVDSDDILPHDYSEISETVQTSPQVSEHQLQSRDVYIDKNINSEKNAAVNDGWVTHSVKNWKAVYTNREKIDILVVFVMSIATFFVGLVLGHTIAK
jgi:hypothetical protein